MCNGTDLQVCPATLEDLKKNIKTKKLRKRQFKTQLLKNEPAGEPTQHKTFSLKDMEKRAYTYIKCFTSDVISEQPSVLPV